MLRTIERMTASGARSRSRPTLLALAVLVVVVGILGMHGLGGHGVTTALKAPAGVTGSLAAAAVHEVDHASRTHAGPAGNSGHRPSPTDHEPGHEHGASGMLMMCVALLAGAAVALAVTLVTRARTTRPWAVLAPAPAPRLPRRFVLRVGTGPPSVWSFSVIRC